jgi:hypothetical protein
LIPKGIAAAITDTTKYKILLLNNSHDRETTGFTSATDYIQAILTACHDSLSSSHPVPPTKDEPWTKYVTHVVYLRGCEIQVDVQELKAKGIECVGVWPARDGMYYDSSVLERTLIGICSGRGGGLQRRATVQNWPIRP